MLKLTWKMMICENRSQHSVEVVCSSKKFELCASTTNERFSVFFGFVLFCLYRFYKR